MRRQRRFYAYLRCEFLRQIHFSPWRGALGRELIDAIVSLAAPRFDALAMQWYQPDEEEPRFPWDGFFSWDGWVGTPHIHAPVLRSPNVIGNRLFVPVHISEKPKREPYTFMGATLKDGVAAVDVVPHWTCAEGLHAHVYARADVPQQYQAASQNAQEVASAFARAEDASFHWAFKRE